MNLTLKLNYLGSAPIAKDVKEFFHISVCAPLLEGYGQTESMGGSFLTEKGDLELGHVGGIQVNYNTNFTF